jgi:hypothetical protein
MQIARYADLFSDEGRERPSRHKNSPSAWKVTCRFKTDSCFVFLSHLAAAGYYKTNKNINSCNLQKLEEFFFALKFQLGQTVKHSEQYILYVNDNS